MKLLTNLLILLVSNILIIGVSSCKKEPASETEIITVYDTVFVSNTDTVLINEEVNTFIFVRHAEKMEGGSDPSLTPEGEERAEELANVLSNVELDRVYSTNYNRTMETAMPTATSQGLPITNYGGFDQDAVIDDILENLEQGTVLIVGHGNTTPSFLNVLTGTSDYPDLEEDEFDNLFIVETKSKGDSKVIHLKYGN